MATMLLAMLSISFADATTTLQCQLLQVAVTDLHFLIVIPLCKYFDDVGC